jgi:hypothetical protein
LYTNIFLNNIIGIEYRVGISQILQLWSLSVGFLELWLQLVVFWLQICECKWCWNI